MRQFDLENRCILIPLEKLSMSWFGKPTTWANEDEQCGTQFRDRQRCGG